MEIKLNKNSWHFKYYSYVVSDNPPKTLCPYFWTMLLIIVLTPLLLIVWALGLVSEKIIKLIDYLESKKKEKTLEEILKIEEQKKKREIFWTKFSEYFSMFVKYIILPFAILVLIFEFYLTVNIVGIGLFFGGLIIILLCLIGLVSIIYYLTEHTPNLKFLNILNPFSWKVTKIVIEMIKTQYTKACPLITWEEKSNPI